MVLQRIKHNLLRLSFEEKVVGIGCVVTAVSLFFPWYATAFLEKTLIESGLSGDLGVIGAITLGMTLISALYLMEDSLRIRLPMFGFVKNKIVLFLMSESAFLTLLTMGIYTKRSLEFTNAELRFGIYTALLGTVAAALGMFTEIRKRETEETKAFFEHPEITAETRSPQVNASETPPAESEESPVAEINEAELEEESFKIETRPPKPQQAQIDIESYKARYQVPVETRSPQATASKPADTQTETPTPAAPEAIAEETTIKQLEKNEVEPIEEQPTIEVSDVQIKEKQRSSGSFYDD